MEPSLCTEIARANIVLFQIWNKPLVVKTSTSAIKIENQNIKSLWNNNKQRNSCERNSILYERRGNSIILLCRFVIFLSVFVAYPW